MNKTKVIDIFVEDIVITPGEDDEHFQIAEQAMACSTFCSWIFNYGGKIKIVVPEKVKQEFGELLHKFD